MTWHVSQRILTLTVLAVTETTCFEQVTTCLGTPRNTAHVAVTPSSGKQLGAQPLSQEHLPGSSRDRCDDRQNDSQRAMPAVLLDIVDNSSFIVVVPNRLDHPLLMPAVQQGRSNLPHPSHRDAPPLLDGRRMSSLLQFNEGAVTVDNT